MAKTIYFATENEKKFDSLSKLLKPIGVDLKMVEVDFNEGRDLDIKKIVGEKLKQAKSKSPNKPVIVDDRGFFIPALKGFPGPFVKLLLDSFSYDGIIKLMMSETDRRAIFSFGIGYFDGKKDHVFSTDEVGFITDRPRGKNLHGWTELLYVYGYKTFPNRSLAELDEIEWQQYLDDVTKVDIFVVLRDFLKIS